MVRLISASGMAALAWFATCCTVACGDDTSPPLVVGYERFHANADGNVEEGGRLLLGELNCTACHAAESSQKEWLAAKPAPVLDAVALRVKPAYLRRFLADPQHVDPGTTMPNLFAGVDDKVRDEQVEALTHFLATGGTVPEMRSDASAAKRGERLFHSVGCAVCHGERRDDAAVLPTSVRLGDLSDKYSILSLAGFLQKPHDVRPGGRMPDLGLDEKQARDVAHFLIPDANPKPTNPRAAFKVYEGSYGNLPDFTTLTPVAEGKADGFDIGVAGLDQNFAIVFEGYLKIEREGEYWFRIGSDDGSRILVDGELVSNNDGVHPYGSVRGARKLTPGVYPVQVHYAQTGGEKKLTVEFEGPEVPSQPLANFVYPTSEAILPKPVARQDATKEPPFELDAELAKQGRELFLSLGCANCHAKKDFPTGASTLHGPELAALDGMKGCLADSPSRPAMAYGLNAKQQASIRAALAKWPAREPAVTERVESALVRFNCYGCHERAGKGGVEADRNSLFATTVPEMGDEGRIPPHLTGVGDKLNVEWMKELLGKGASDRTYMRTRMPNFGSDNVGFLAEAFASLDARTEVTIPTVDLPKHRIEAVGRELVGESALSCIKCHNFGEYSGTGIQAINLQTMARRLRQDWFVRYMPDPQEYRPGTRMPSAFANGKSVVRSVLDGKADPQLAVIWQYLELGAKAPVPAGVITSAIMLTPTDRPVIYRNFIEGLSPRGIAVGYPEKANIAFDAERMSLSLIWHNAFIDASKHWAGRGSGTQRPSGDHVLSLVPGVPLATLANPAAAWPTEPAKKQGWQFHGYSLDERRRPVFRYGTSSLNVEDTPQPIAANAAGASDAVLHRVINIEGHEGQALPSSLFFRVASADSIENVGGKNYRIDDAITIRLAAHPDSPTPVVREVAGRKELLVPVAAGPGTQTLEIDYEW